MADQKTQSGPVNRNTQPVDSMAAARAARKGKRRNAEGLSQAHLDTIADLLTARKRLGRMVLNLRQGGMLPARGVNSVVNIVSGIDPAVIG